MEENTIMVKMTKIIGINECDGLVLWIFTSNFAENMYDKWGYTDMFKNYIGFFNDFIGPAKYIAVGETLQVNDYEKYAWSQFDVADRKKRRKEVFPKELKSAFNTATEMFG